jgi:hypothetical protein
MRLIEEKNLMKLNIISMIFIVLTSLFIQISDHYVEEGINLAFIKVLLLIQKEQFKTNHDFKSRFYTLYQALDIEAHNEKDKIDPGETSDNYENLNLHKDRIELRRQFKSGIISAEEYTNERIKFHRRQSEKYRKYYNSIWQSIQNTKPPIWNLIKGACFVVQIVGVCLLVFGYSMLSILIQNRVYSGKSKKETSSKKT